MSLEYGAAMWAQGTEGAYLQDGKTITCLEKYAELEPNRMQQNYPPFITLDLYNNNDNFINSLKELGLDSLRTSISWARLFPDGKNVNEKALEFYLDFFSKIRSVGCKIWITLYWFDMPVFQEDKGGFMSSEVREDFVEYCTYAIRTFDKFIEIFYVYNEPQVDLNFKYLSTHSYPFEVDIQKNYQSQIYMLECQARVIEEHKNNNYTSKIGTVINICKVYARSNNEKDIEAKNNLELLDYKPWLETSINGAYPIELINLLASKGIKLTLTDEQIMLFKKNRIETLGINYYFPQRVKSRDEMYNEDAIVIPQHFYDDYNMPGKKMNKDRGWEIFPEGIYDVLHDIKEFYSNIETNITENGIGVQNEQVNTDGIVEDDYRIQFAIDSLEQCERAIKDGANLKGYHIWSLVDLWSPTNQFLNKYGLIYFDNETFEFSLKKSGHWYKKYIVDKKG